MERIAQEQNRDCEILAVTARDDVTDLKRQRSTRMKFVVKFHKTKLMQRSINFHEKVFSVYAHYRARDLHGEERARVKSMIIFNYEFFH
jgi:hypothetical protein